MFIGVKLFDFIFCPVMTENSHSDRISNAKTILPLCPVAIWKCVLIIYDCDWIYKFSCLGLIF
jgi:hypothetical protein